MIEQIKLNAKRVLATWTPAKLANKGIARFLGYILLIILVGFPIAQSAMDAFVSDKIITGENFIKVDEGKSLISGNMAQDAYHACNRFANDVLAVDHKTMNIDEDFNAWNLQSSRFLIKAHGQTLQQSGASTYLKYTCIVEFLGGEHNRQANWELKGLEF